MRSLPRDVKMNRTVIITRARHAEIISLMCTAAGRILPNIFWIITLEDRKSVMMTEMVRQILAQPRCGDDDIKCSSLIQRRRQIEKKGRRHPLNTWAIRITTVLSAKNIIHLKFNGHAYIIIFRGATREFFRGGATQILALYTELTFHVQ